MQNFNNPEDSPEKLYKSSHKFRLSFKNPGQILLSQYKANEIFISQKKIIKKQEEAKLQSILQWRKITEFPIVKVKNYENKQIKLINQEVKIEFFISIQNIQKSLSQISNLSFIQSLYVCRQSIVGFQRLFHRFGSFELNENLIKFNKNKRCKVWINNNCFQNQPQYSNSRSQQQFVQTLCKILKRKTIRTKQTCQFFQKIQSQKCFFSIIGQIDRYVNEQKIQLPYCIQNIDQLTNSYLRQNTYKRLTISDKIPSFLKNSWKNKKTSQKQIDLLKKRSQINQKKFMERSLTAVSRNNISNCLSKQISSNFFKIQQDQKFEESRQKIISIDQFLTKLNIRKVNVETSISNAQSKMYSYISQRTLRCNIYQINRKYPTKSTYTFKKEVKSFMREQNQNKKVNSNFIPKNIITQKSNVDNANGFDQYGFSQMQLQRVTSSFDLIENKQRKLSQNLLDINIRNSKQTQRELRLNVKPSQGYKYLEVSLSKRRKTQQIHISQNRQLQEISQNIMTINGWKGLSLFNPKSPNLQQSYIQGPQILIRNCFTTSQLPILGSMGRDIQTSMISQMESRYQFQARLEREQDVNQDIMRVIG